MHITHPRHPSLPPRVMRNSDKWFHIAITASLSTSIAVAYLLPVAFADMPVFNIVCMQLDLNMCLRFEYLFTLQVKFTMCNSTSKARPYKMFYCVWLKIPTANKDTFMLRSQTCYMYRNVYNYIYKMWRGALSWVVRLHYTMV